MSRMTEHSILTELHTNGNITLHVHLAASIVGMWYAPYENPHTITFQQLFQQL